MKKALLVVVFSSFLCSSLWAEDPVYFADPVLKAAVEEALWVSDPTPTDMLGLTELTFVGRWDQEDEIQSLEGLEYASNLQSLNLCRHEISDLSPLAGLSNLQTLILERNNISDLSPLATVTNLQTLILRLNHVSDASPLASLKKLQTVSIHRNQLSDLSPLASLTSLQWLDLRINPLNREAYDTYIAQIFANNPGIWFMYDPSFERRIITEAMIGGHILSPGEGAFTYMFGDSIWLIAEPSPYFQFAGWSGSYASGQNPAYLLVDQDYDVIANFTSVLNCIYVDAAARQGGGPEEPNENGTSEHPFNHIQEAIEVAARGALVVVRPGLYRENINLLGKDIHVTGRDPNGTTYPVLEGTGAGPAVSFVSGEGPDCRLTGFVLTRGKGQAAILCRAASPTVANCLIVGNHASEAKGGAVQCTRSSAVLLNCTVADNYGGPQGAGLVLIDSPITLTNAIVWGNSPTEILSFGDSTPSIRYCDIRSGWEGAGNLDVDPLFARPGAWVNAKDLQEALPPADKRAIWSEGDYHLKSRAGRWDPVARAWVQDDSNSPGLDRGDPASPLGHEPVPNAGLINLGAYGGTSQASKSDGSH